MTTALSYIESAMGKLGMLNAGDVVSAEDAALGILRLNTLLDAMENEGMFGYATVNTSVTLPAATTSRTIGAGMQINMTRPVKLLIGGYTRVGDIDYPLQIINEQQYNDIALKSTSGGIAPSAAFFDGGNPTGVVYFWPPTNAQVTVTLITPTAKTAAADTTTAFVYPPGYDRYIEHALAMEMAPDFDVTPSPHLRGSAASAKRLIKRTNSRTPQLDLNYPNRRGGISLGDFEGGRF